MIHKNNIDKRWIESAKLRLQKNSTSSSNGCIIWTGSLLDTGYGQMWVGGVMMRVHRVAWIVKHGPIPQGKCVCHTCDNPPCMNDDHLFLGTRSENARDMVSKMRFGNQWTNRDKRKEAK